MVAVLFRVQSSCPLALSCPPGCRSRPCGHHPPAARTALWPARQLDSRLPGAGAGAGAIDTLLCGGVA